MSSTLTLRETAHLQAGALLMFIARYLDRALETEILSRFCCSTPLLQLPDRWAVWKAGIHQAPSIKVAEAAKVIENCQRDINIGFVNELSGIFNRLGIDTEDVLRAAGTKWNFLNFQPGLVGGHCIGVDPFYLAFQAQRHGYHPEVILSGRRVNDNLAERVAQEAGHAARYAE